MRLWSLHPENLDAKGLLAVWREGLLAKHVLLGKTKGYKNHPQLIRFKNTNDPVMSINQYLAEVFREAERRGYEFNKDKVDFSYTPVKIKVTSGQIDFEISHLKKKLKVRDPQKYRELARLNTVRLHPIFSIIKGPVEKWEVLDTK